MDNADYGQVGLLIQPVDSNLIDAGQHPLNVLATHLKPASKEMEKGWVHCASQSFG